MHEVHLGECANGTHNLEFINWITASKNLQFTCLNTDGLSERLFDIAMRSETQIMCRIVFSICQGVHMGAQF